MSALAVAIGGKADVGCCAACLLMTKADIGCRYQSGLIESGSEYAARADDFWRGSAGGITFAEVTRFEDVVFGGGAGCLAGRGSDRLSPQALAIAGPAAYPIAAPASAPMGPKTTAPDTAPSAASPTRSSASAGDGAHQITIAAATAIFFMGNLPRKEF
jgi:hypothetical protein